MIEKNDFFPIGIGTYNLNLKDKENTLKGLLYSFEKGQNFMSTALVYDNCKVVEFLKNFFQLVDRNKIFLMSHLERHIEKVEDVEKQIDEYLTKIGIDYIDSVQVHASYVSKIPLVETYSAINELIKKGKDITSPYHKKIIEKELPYTIGGGIGTSRVLMLLLEKSHIAEVQASSWEDKTLEELKDYKLL